MRPLTTFLLLSNMLGCTPQPEAVEATEALPQGISWIGTVFSSNPDPPELPALQLSLPEAQFKVIDHLYNPVRAREARVPSNGYVHLARLNSNGNVLGAPSVFPLVASADDITMARKQLERPLLRALQLGTKSAIGSDESRKTSTNSLLEMLAQHDVVLSQDGPADLLLLLGPLEDLSEADAELARAHRSSGAPLLVAVEPESPGHGATRLAALLTSLGVEMKPGLVASDHQQVWETLGTPSPGDQYNHAANRFLAHPSIEGLSDPKLEGLSVVFSRAALLQPRRSGSAKAIPTVLSHKSAWSEIDGDGVFGGEERQDSLPLVLASEGGAGRPFRALVFADSSALSDRWALHPGNQVLLRDGINWLLPQRPVPEAKTLSAFAEPVSPAPIFQGQGPLEAIQLIQPEQTLHLQQRRDLFGNYSWVRRQGSNGEVVEFKGNAQVDQAWVAFGPLHALRSWANPGETHRASLGFKNKGPILRLVEKGGRARDLHLGGKPYNGTGRYAWDPVSDRILLLQAADLHFLLQPPEALEDFSFIPKGEWARMEISADTDPMRFEPRLDHWVLAGRGPSADPNANKKVTRLVEALQTLRTMGPADLGKNGRSPDPLLESWFALQNGDAISLRLAKLRGQWVAESDHSRIWSLISEEAAEEIVELVADLK